MNRISMGLVCGLGFAAVTALIMFFAPASWESPRQKQEAIAGAFIGRFMSGFVIPFVDLGIPVVLTGVLVSLGISLSPAIMSRRYAPVLISAIIGGAIIGWLSGKFVVC